MTGAEARAANPGFQSSSGDSGQAVSLSEPLFHLPLQALNEKVCEAPSKSLQHTVGALTPQ